MKKTFLIIVLISTMFTIKVSASVQEIDLNQEIVIEDENLLAQLKEKLSIEESIKVKDILKLEEISLTDIKSLDGMEYASNLRTLEIIDSKVNLEAVNELINLNSLIVLNCEADFSNISQAISLEILNIEDCAILDISFLEGLFNLKELSLSNNYISDTMSLINLFNLERLNLSNNYLTSILDIFTLSNMGAFSSTGAAINLDDNYLDVEPESFNCFYFDLMKSKGIEVSYDEQNVVEEISRVIINSKGMLYDMNLNQYMNAKACEKFIFDDSQNKLLEIEYVMGRNNYYSFSDYANIKEELGGHVYKSLGFLNSNNYSTSVNSVPFEFE